LRIADAPHWLFSATCALAAIAAFRVRFPAQMLFISGSFRQIVG
jgi:hypothetical protein